jgi:hypothetical protein
MFKRDRTRLLNFFPKNIIIITIIDLEPEPELLAFNNTPLSALRSALSTLQLL